MMDQKAEERIEIDREKRQRLRQIIEADIAAPGQGGTYATSMVRAGLIIELLDALDIKDAVLTTAHEKFRFYEAQHLAKDTGVSRAKALVNNIMALECEFALQGLDPYAKALADGQDAA